MADESRSCTPMHRTHMPLDKEKCCLNIIILSVEQLGTGSLGGASVLWQMYGRGVGARSNEHAMQSSYCEKAGRWISGLLAHFHPPARCQIIESGRKWEGRRTGR